MLKMKLVRMLCILIVGTMFLYGCSGGGGGGGGNDNDADRDGYPKPVDCHDNNPFIYPGAKEICGDFIDQDCDGRDLPCDLNDIDNDGDGYTEKMGDCNDSDPKIHPKAVEICGDKIDQNCDGVDPACPVTTTTSKNTTTTVPSVPTTTSPPTTTTTTIVPSIVTTTTLSATTTSTLPPASTTTTIFAPIPTTTIQTTVPTTTTSIGVSTTTIGTSTTLVVPTTTTTTVPTTTTTTPTTTTTTSTTTTIVTTTTTTSVTSTTSTTTTTSTSTTTTTTTTTTTSTTTTIPITDAISKFASDFQTSLNQRDINLLMSRVSRSYLHNGQDGTCYRQIWDWRFSRYTFQNVQYSINNTIINGQRATVNATLNYLINGISNTLSVIDYFILEDNIWKLYGNQSNNSDPFVLEMYAIDKSFNNPSSVISTSALLADVGVKIVIENAKNNIELAVKFYQPNGIQFGQTQLFNILLGNYPDCARFSFSWTPDPTITIPNYPEYYGTWRVELLANGVRLHQIEFQFVAPTT